LLVLALTMDEDVFFCANEMTSGGSLVEEEMYVVRT